MRQQLEQLKLIKKSKSCSATLKKCSKNTIKSLCECVLNLLKGNIPLTQYQKRKLKPHKRSLRKLADKSIPLYKKRRLLVNQKGGGFLSVLLPAAISVISSLINGV